MTQIANGEAGSSVRAKINATGLAPSKFNATTAPGVLDDDNDSAGRGDGLNFEIGSTWVDTVLEHAYFCEDATTGAAVWHRIGAPKYNGSLYISTAMTSAPAGTPVKIGTASGASTELLELGFTHTSPGRLTYSGIGSERFVIAANLSMTHSGSNVTASFYIAINGTIATGSRIDRKIGSGTDAGALALRWVTVLAPNDFIEVFASVPSGTLSVNYGVIDIALRGN